MHCAAAILWVAAIPWVAPTSYGHPMGCGHCMDCGVSAMPWAKQSYRLRRPHVVLPSSGRRGCGHPSGCGHASGSPPEVAAVPSAVAIPCSGGPSLVPILWAAAMPLVAPPPPPRNWGGAMGCSHPMVRGPSPGPIPWAAAVRRAAGGRPHRLWRSYGLLQSHGLRRRSHGVRRSNELWRLHVARRPQGLRRPRRFCRSHGSRRCNDLRRLHGLQRWLGLRRWYGSRRWMISGHMGRINVPKTSVLVICIHLSVWRSRQCGSRTNCCADRLGRRSVGFTPLPIRAHLAFAIRRQHLRAQSRWRWAARLQPHCCALAPARSAGGLDSVAARKGHVAGPNCSCAFQPAATPGPCVRGD